MEATLTMPQLTAEQQVVHDTLVRFAKGSSVHDAMVLKGYAGTGKTFTITKVIQTLKNEDNIFNPTSELNIAVSAPTHKAVRVLKKFSTFQNDVTFATIHSLLGLKEEITPEGKIKYVESKDPNLIRITSFNVLFIDESSMLADELFLMLIQYIRHGLRIIFLGDPIQIPPVNHADSMPFKENSQKYYNIGVLELKSIIRQARGNPILEYATRIRMDYKTANDFMVETHVQGSGENGIIKLSQSDTQKTKDILKEYFVSEEFRQDADHMKVIAWRNAVVNGYNQEIRKLIYPDVTDLPFIMVGEKLIMDAPLKLSSGNTLLTTNEEIEVIGYEVKSGKSTILTAAKVDKDYVSDYRDMEFKFYDTQVKYLNDRGTEIFANIRILHENSEGYMNEVLKGITVAAKAVDRASALRNQLWKSFFKTQRLFAQVKYNYAITGHKSQGSTYSNCMVAEWDIAYNKNVEERNRIRYVAATRARHLLFVIK